MITSRLRAEARKYSNSFQIENTRHKDFKHYFAGIHHALLCRQNELMQALAYKVDVLLSSVLGIQMMMLGLEM